MKRSLWVWVGLSMFSVSSAGSLEDFLLKTEQVSSVQSAKVGVSAALAQVKANQGRLDLGVQGGYGGTEFSGLPAGADPWQYGKQLSATLTLRPILYGDVADAEMRAKNTLQQAQNGLRFARTIAQTQALLGVYQVELAEEGVSSSEKGLELAKTLLAVAQVQRDRGLNTATDLQSAEQSVREAEERAISARENLQLAKLNLFAWVGETTLDHFPDLPIPTGKTSEEDNAEIQLKSAQMILGQAERSVLPTLSANYTYNASDKTSVSATLESRTLQPKVNVTFSDSKQNTSNITQTQSFQLGAVFTWGPAVGDAYLSAQEQVRSAELGLESAQKNAKLTRENLTIRLEQAQRNLALKQSSLELARKKLEQALERQKLGLVSPLVPLQAQTEQSAAEVALSSAQLDALSRLLDFYRTYGKAIYTP
ncbi:MAG: TolC family protein [Deinococcaceae bacterium]